MIALPHCLRWSVAAIAAVLLPIAAAAAEPLLPGGSALGMTVPELQRTGPALKRVPHPARLGGGLVGSWSGPAIDLAGLAVSPTYFFADGQLRRVEYLARGRGPAAYAALLAWARAAWGAELAVADPEGAYASWSTQDFDAYLQLASPTPAGQVRLVIKQRVLKDASEL
ncbi:hypothetical protein ACPWT1_12375 [Ramlibacter sp. MMS24-I3-19]|uniref:hypothetical protein n=1 Tax=Ramlibacter sp. MMS24-I3-19 TaxID=3416606 RepID=UPI003D052194